MGFWDVDALKLALKKPLEMLLYRKSVVKEDNHTQKKKKKPPTPQKITATGTNIVFGEKNKTQNGDVAHCQSSHK